MNSDFFNTFQVTGTETKTMSKVLFAAVKLFKDLKKLEIVETTEIHNFDHANGHNFDGSKRYRLKSTGEEICITCVEESLDALTEKMVKSRQRTRPMTKLHSASDLTDSEKEIAELQRQRNEQ